MAHDVVCGMQVDEAQAASKRLTSEYHGQNYFFCSPQCKLKFEQEPQRYARAAMPSESDQKTGERDIG